MTGLIPFRREGRELNRFRDEMDRLFNRFFDLTPGEDVLGTGEWFPAVDVSEQDSTVKVQAEVPGMDPKDIDISVEGRTLHLRGERKDEHEEKDRNYYRMERSYGAFSRAVGLPADVKEDRAEAQYKDGVLTITLPKTEEQTKKKIEVKSS